jgi:hypothetical protein
MAEIKRILAVGHLHIAIVSAAGKQQRSKRGALCITSEGLLDEPSQTIIRRGPQPVEWSDFYAKALRHGEIVVVEDAPATPAPAVERPARGKGDSR